ncbi:hypothetical protein JOQ06_013506, partial [Pogonophryne albipinna]
NDVVVTVQTQGGGREGEKETQELQNDVVVTVQTQGGGREGEKETQELQNDVVTVQTQGGGRGSEKETQELQMRLQDQYPFPQASSQLKEREGPRARQPTRRAEVKRQKYQYKKRSRTMKAAQMRRKQLWTVNVRDKVRLRHRMPQILSHL